MILCEYPSFLVLWCENDCNDAFDAFFIMSTLQSMCNFSALLSVNKPKICFRGPKMTKTFVKMWHKQVYLATKSICFEKWDILGHFHTVEFWRNLKDFMISKSSVWFLTRWFVVSLFRFEFPYLRSSDRLVFCLWKNGSF